MINLYYSEAYWGHSQTMNGPHKVIDNLIKSLEQEEIDYAINEESKDTRPFQFTFWHNSLFNRSIPPDIKILSFLPDWRKSEVNHLYTKTKLYH